MADTAALIAVAAQIHPASCDLLFPRGERTAPPPVPLLIGIDAGSRAGHELVRGATAGHTVGPTLSTVPQSGSAFAYGFSIGLGVVLAALAPSWQSTPSAHVLAALVRRQVEIVVDESEWFRAA